MTEVENRRPLKVRQIELVGGVARWLCDKQVTPNKISVASVFFALAAAACLLLMPIVASNTTWVLPLLAAFFIQCRLLCNLFDGMVAVEGGKSTPSGELFNDIPDRLADPLLLVSAGYAISVVSWADALGWAAGLAAVLTAYIRTLSASTGAPVDFRGPMAKQHRMAVLTGACLLTTIESQVWQRGWILLLALMVITIGCVVTAIRRATAAYAALEDADSAARRLEECDDV